MRERTPARLTIVLAVLAAMPSAIAAAQARPAPQLTPQALVDRANIEDLLTRYYYNLGHASADSFSAFYAHDAELVLGGKSYKGREGIESAYKSARANPDNPRAAAFAFNTLLSNPLIVVRGDSATAQIIFTETIVDKQGGAPRILVQGREYDDLVRVDGAWKFKRRQIVAGTQPPAGWQD